MRRTSYDQTATSRWRTPTPGPTSSSATWTRTDCEEETGGYLHTEGLEGAKTFALWPLSQAAQSCFGKDSWPDEIPAPQGWLELDVDSVESATTALAARGYRMLVKNRKEPWGQIVSRFLSPEGLLLGITFTPSMRDKKI
jgi:hypothetical protein